MIMGGVVSVQTAKNKKNTIRLNGVDVDIGTSGRTRTGMK